MSAQPQVPPPIFLLGLVTGFWKSKVIHAAAFYQFADHLENGPLHFTKIAEVSNLNADAVYRTLRALTTLGLFQELEGGNFQNTPLSEFLKTSHPFSIRSAALAEAGDVHYLGWNNFTETLRTGEPGLLSYFQISNFFQVFEKFPDYAKHFSEHMSKFSNIQVPAVLDGYPDLAQANSYVDIGGSEGFLTIEVLKRFQNIKEGYSYDLPQVTEVGKSSQLVGPEGRFFRVHGSFFDTPSNIPEGKDVYSAKVVIHDWSDEKSVVILENIKKAMRSDSKLLLLEAVLDGTNELFIWADLHMMQICGGKERTKEQWESLLAKVGMKVSRIIKTQSLHSIIEVVKA